MPDETQRPHEAEPQPEYDPPQAEDMPDPSGPVGTAPAIDTGQDHSDRDLKTGFAQVDAAATLARVRDLPITTWSYREDDPAVRHVGPMAQDFAAAFGVGDDDRRIHTVDANGVALAAIQALAARLEAAEARIAELTGSRPYEPPRAEELTDPVAASPDVQPTSPSDDFTSDRDAKTGFADVDVQAVLARVREHPVDANGVALASIQALAARLEAAEARVARLEAEPEGDPV